MLLLNMAAKKTSTRTPKQTLETLVSSLAQTVEKLTAEISELKQSYVPAVLESTTETMNSTLEEIHGQTAPQPDLDQLEQINGRVGTEEDALEKTKRVEEMLGVSHANPWGTVDLDVFDKFLNDATPADLQKKARDVGLAAYGTPSELRHNLRSAFQRDNKQAYAAVKTQQSANDQVNLDPSNPKHLKVMQMLGMVTSKV